MKLSVLKAPFPFHNSIPIMLRSALFYGGFVFLFLYVFQPFGLNQYNSPNKLWQLAGYGLVTSFCLLSSNLVFYFFTPVWFSAKTWTVGKNILYMTWMFFFIGLGNLFYSHLLSFFSLNLSAFLHFQALTLMVGAFPVSISTFIVYNRKLKAALEKATELNRSIQPQKANTELNVLLPSKNKSEELSIAINSLLFIKATENYVEVYQKDGEGIYNKSIIRNTLKDIEVYLKDYHFIQKCHRSYLVNLQLILQFKGNAQGLTLNFKGLNDLEIPVSRSYVKQIKAELEQ